MNEKAMKLCKFWSDVAGRLRNIGAGGIAAKAEQKATHYQAQMWPDRPAPVRGLDYYYEWKYSEFLRRVYPKGEK